MTERGKSTAHQKVRVLVVDDQAPMREIARRILEREGYEVDEASTGPDAIERLSTGGPLDLLVADLQMPDLPGEEMARQIRSVRHDLKVLYVSGCVEQLFMTRPTLWEGEAFLEKPYTAKGLTEAVALLLFGSLTKPAR